MKQKAFFIVFDGLSFGEKKKKKADKRSLFASVLSLVFIPIYGFSHAF